MLKQKQRLIDFMAWFLIVFAIIAIGVLIVTRFF